MFVAQTIIRDMERAGREEEIKQISMNISEVAPGIAGEISLVAANSYGLIE